MPDDGKVAQNALTGPETAELAALEGLVAAAKLRPGSEEWGRWLWLVGVKGGEAREAPAAAPVAQKAPIRRDFKDWGAFYFADSSVAARVKRIDRLRRDGRKAGLLPPIDNPAAMPGWFEEMRARGHYPRGCPAEFLAAAVRSPGSAPVAVSAGGSVPAPAGDASEPVDSTPVTGDEIDPARVVQRLEEDEARLHRRYETARTSGRPVAELDLHRRRWNEASTLLSGHRAAMARLGQLIPESTATDAFRRILHPLPVILERQMVKNPPRPGEPWPQTVQRVIRDAFKGVPQELAPLLSA